MAPRRRGTIRGCVPSRSSRPPPSRPRRPPRTLRRACSPSPAVSRRPSTSPRRAGDARLFIVEQGGRIRVLRAGKLTHVPRHPPERRRRWREGPPVRRVPPGLRDEPQALRQLHRRRARTAWRRGSSSTARRATGRCPAARACCCASTSRTRTTTAASWRSGRTASCTSAWATAAPAATRRTARRTRASSSARCCASTSTTAPAGGRTRSRATNPYRRGGGRPEIWALGVRNPWRFSFDRNGDLWIGDVGQGAVEEIDFVRPRHAAGCSTSAGTPSRAAARSTRSRRPGA